jgi:HEAT repeat protein
MTELHKLLEGLRESDWWARREAIAALVSCPEQEYRTFLEEGIRNHEDADIRNASIEVFRALGARAIPALVSLSKDPDPEVRLFTANILCEIPDESALPILAALIKDPDTNVRAASAEAMGKIGDGDCLAMLKKALEDETWVAMAAIMAMGDIGGDEALGILYKCLEHEDYREIAITALEKAGKRDSIRCLTPYFDYADLSGPVLKAIVKIAEREHLRPHPEYFINLVPKLIEMVGSPDKEERLRAFTALCWAKDMSGLPYIIEALRDEELQEPAIEGLLGIGRKVVCGIVDELRASSGSHRLILAKVLDMLGESRALLQFADDEDPEVRAQVALSLGTVDLKRASSALSKMLSDPYEEVRLAAEKSLADLREKGFPV